MTKFLIVGLIVSIDSFFVELLISRKSVVSAVMILVSPFFHMVFSSLGYLMQQNITTLLGKSLFVIVALLVLAAGALLVVSYKPQKAMVQKLHDKQGTSAWIAIILIGFCSLDALIAGFIYGYWSAGILRAALYVWTVNFAVIISAFIIGIVLGRDVTKLAEECSYE